MGIEMKADTVLVLGGTSGLGQDIADEYQKRGAYTIRVGRSVQDQELGDRMEMYCDLADRAATFEFVERLKATGKTIDRFFWTAARHLEGSFEDAPIEEVLETIDVNETNPLIVAQYVWRQMQSSQEDKSFVVVSSTSGKKFRPGEAVYSMGKYAQVGFTGGIGGEIRNPNLRVTLFGPGGMKSRLYRKDPDRDLSAFMDTDKVAALMVEKVMGQTTPFEDIDIPRGSV